jgi:hypothetical protein
MTKKKSSGGSDDRTTSRGTVKGQHHDPDDAVPEGGKAASPKQDHGSPKGSASRAIAEGTDMGDGTSNATVGKREKEQAEAANAGKPQSGHGGGGG